MNQDDRHKELLTAINRLAIAVGSLNPDPEKTIDEHRSEQRQAKWLSVYAAITSTIAIVITVYGSIFQGGGH